MIYIRHQRHKRFPRTRHSKKYLAFLVEQATRLTTTPMHIFTMLSTGYTSEQIAGLTSMPSGGSEVVLPALTNFAVHASEVTAPFSSDVTVYADSFVPWNGDSGKIVWTSSDEDIATVEDTDALDAQANIQGVKAGKVTITATAGSVVKTIDITFT